MAHKVSDNKEDGTEEIMRASLCVRKSTSAAAKLEEVGMVVWVSQALECKNINNKALRLLLEINLLDMLRRPVSPATWHTVTIRRATVITPIEMASTGATNNAILSGTSQIRATQMPTTGPGVVKLQSVRRQMTCPLTARSMDMGLVCGIRPPITRREVFLGCIPTPNSELALI